MEDLVITEFKRARQFKSDKDRYLVYDKRPNAGICGIIRGSILFKFDNEEILCQKNDAILIPEGTKYRIEYPEETDFLLFDFKTLQKECEIRKLEGLNLYKSFKIIRSYSMSTNTAKLHFIMAELYKILSKFSYEEPSDRIERLVSGAEKIIVDRFDESDLECKNIAKSLGISEAYLRTTFKEVYGITPGQYLLKTRMNEALMLLVGGVSVTETAQMVGYKDVFQFSRAYKKYYGYSPRFAKEHYSVKTNNPERYHLKK